MKLVILDALSINPGDLSWAPLEAICDFQSYDRTGPEEILEHIDDCTASQIADGNDGADGHGNQGEVALTDVVGDGLDMPDVDSGRMQSADDVDDQYAEGDK